ncbi:MAG TPA: twin-arginine translocase subunit TatC [Bdellovibrionales bacterium]|nr:twin-arginine translocase subunit TatC [Bdellovibrionales bacterium]
MAQDELQADQTLVEHLGELRYRLLMAIYGIVPAFALCWWQSDWIFEFVRRPIVPFLKDGGLIYTGILDKFMAYLQLSLLASVLLTCPWWLYQVWAFVAPGLYKKEKKFALSFLFFGSGLFLSGAAFVYTVVYPAAFGFLLQFGGEADRPMITIDNYLSFFVSTTLVFGVCFELPLILAILGMLGIIDQNFLRTKRRYAVVVLATVSAVITPPDLLSMLFLLVPMMILYEIGILVVGMLQPKALEDQSSNSVTET